MQRLFLLWVFLLVFSSGSVFAQAFVTKADLDKREQKLFEEAEALSRRQQLEAARDVLGQVVDRQPNAIDAWLFRAQLSYDLGEWTAAATDYERALQLSATHAPEALYQLGLVKSKLEQFDEAATLHERYLAAVPATDRRRARVQALLDGARIAADLKRNPVPFAPYSLGDSINTPGLEYLPSFSADGNWLVYTVNYDGQEDFYFSGRLPDGTWRKGQPLSGVNTPKNEGAQTISADGRVLFFTGCQWPDSYGGCDLYYARREGDTWSKVRHAASHVNSPHWDTQPSLSANGDVLYFTSTRPGGLGGSDIWMTRLRPDGQWGRAENVGAPINTAADDQSPFLHPDGQTLYFMSEGHPGLGESDLFVSRRSEDGTWQTPQNLGYPINTVRREGALVVSLDGKTAYYTTDQNTKPDGKPNLDIYAFELHDAVRPAPATYVRGRVTDGSTSQRLADVAIALAIDGQTEAFATTMTDKTGEFLVVLPAGKNYQLEANRTGYLFYSDRFELAEATHVDAPFELEMNLMPVPSGGGVPAVATPVVLRNVLFDTGSSALLPASEPELRRLAQLLAQQPNLRIRINGHTDDVGDATTNQRLSEDRAKAVYTHLVAQGIAADRLSYKGFGEDKPLVPNTTDEARRQNRRTEFEVVGN